MAAEGVAARDRPFCVAQGCAILRGRNETPPLDQRPRTPINAQQVAERAGVSRSAVSRTFTPGASVSAATRAKVLRAASELGYHVNHLARGLINQETGIVCLLIGEMATPYQAAFLDIATRRLQAIGKVVMVLNTAGEAEATEAALRQTLNYRADATVVVSGSPPVALVETCVANGQRVIMINRDDVPEGTERILVDNAAAAAEALMMLNRAGCRRIAMVGSTAGTPSIVARETSFVAAAAAGGIEVQLCRLGPTSYATGAETARQLFASARRPDGVFCVTDLMALGFMDTARQQFGRRIPDDLCVVGFDDIPQAGWAGYELTTFRQPLDTMVERIVAILAGESGGVSFPAPIVWRRSVRP
jgi:DNA-binding LacI/PurR family transcriptional regulator